MTNQSQQETIFNTTAWSFIQVLSMCGHDSVKLTLASNQIALDFRLRGHRLAKIMHVG